MMAFVRSVVECIRGGGRRNAAAMLDRVDRSLGDLNAVVDRETEVVGTLTESRLREAEAAESLRDTLAELVQRMDGGTDAAGS